MDAKRLQLLRRVVFVLILQIPTCRGQAAPVQDPTLWSKDVIKCKENEFVVIEEVFHAIPEPEVCDAQCRQGPKATSGDLCYFRDPNRHCVQTASEDVVSALYDICQPSPSSPITCNVTGLGQHSLTVGYSCLTAHIFDPFNRTFSWRDRRVGFAVGLNHNHNNNLLPSNPRLSRCHVLYQATTDRPQIKITALLSPPRRHAKNPDPVPAGVDNNSTFETTSADFTPETFFSNSAVTSKQPNYVTPKTSDKETDQNSSSSSPADTDDVSGNDVTRLKIDVTVIVGGVRKTVKESRYPYWWVEGEREFWVEFRNEREAGIEGNEGGGDGGGEGGGGEGEGGGVKLHPTWLLLEDLHHQNQLEVRCEVNDVLTSTTARPTTTTTRSEVTEKELLPMDQGYSLKDLVAVGVAVVAVLVVSAGLLGLVVCLVQRHRRRNQHIETNDYAALQPRVSFENRGDDSVAYVNATNDASTSDPATRELPSLPPPQPVAHHLRDRLPRGSAISNGGYSCYNDYSSGACAQPKSVYLPPKKGSDENDGYLSPVEHASRKNTSGRGLLDNAGCQNLGEEGRGGERGGVGGFGADERRCGAAELVRESAIIEEDTYEKLPG